MTTRYTKDHEYIRVEGDEGVVGISDYAQAQLGDVVYVELPAVGKVLGKGDDAAVVESVKAASEIFAPVAGTVTATNSDLEGTPALVNEDPAGKGWFLKIKIADPAELEGLLTEEAYAEFVTSIS